MLATNSRGGRGSIRGEERGRLNLLLGGCVLRIGLTDTA